MRICSRCGAEIPDGELICPSCGYEVRLVPDYETMESRMQEQKIREEKEARERARLEREQEEERAKRKRTRRFHILLVVGVAAIALMVFFIYRNLHGASFEGQMEKAEAAFEEERYADALGFAEKAVSLNSSSPEAETLLGRIYEAQEEYGKAEKAYETAIRNDGDYAAAYEYFVPLCAEQKSYENLQKVLKNCTNKSILQKYADYITYDPVFSLKEGDYTTSQTLELSSEGKGTIYYTTDGSSPSEDSEKYRDAISLEEGFTEVRAVYISPEGIPGDVVSKDYTITLDAPSAPDITPASGIYSSTSEMKITVNVPSGYTAYYSFDSRATAASTKYTGPVTMPEGSHIFYAVLVGPNGKEGDVASATYRFTKKTATPQPTATPTPEAKDPTSELHSSDVEGSGAQNAEQDETDAGAGDGSASQQ